MDLVICEAIRPCGLNLDSDGEVARVWVEEVGEYLLLKSGQVAAVLLAIDPEHAEEPGLCNGAGRFWAASIRSVVAGVRTAGCSAGRRALITSGVGCGVLGQRDVAADQQDGVGDRAEPGVAVRDSQTGERIGVLISSGGEREAFLFPGDGVEYLTDSVFHDRAVPQPRQVGIGGVQVPQLANR